MPQITYPEEGTPQSYTLAAALNYVWDINTLEYVHMTQPSGGGGGGDASAANQLLGNASLSSIDGKVLTDAQLRATPVPISGTVATGSLTDAQLRAVAVPVSGTVTANVGSGTQPVSGTFWQATQPVSGTFFQATQPVSGTVSTKTALTASAPAAATIGVASAQAVAANANRKGLALVNLSNNRISLGFGQTAVLDSGVTLYPGGSFEMDEFLFYLGAVNAIASAASSLLAIQECAT